MGPTNTFTFLDFFLRVFLFFIFDILSINYAQCADFRLIICFN